MLNCEIVDIDVHGRKRINFSINTSTKEFEKLLERLKNEYNRLEPFLDIDTIYENFMDPKGQKFSVCIDEFEGNCIFVSEKVTTDEANKLIEEIFNKISLIK